MKLTENEIKFSAHEISSLDKKIEKIKYKIVSKIPKCIEANHLTLMTIFWSISIIAVSLLSKNNILWILFGSIIQFGQWVTDTLDGALGRYRHTGLCKWGYYMDHFLDFIFTCSTIIGFCLIADPKNSFYIALMLIPFSGLFVHSFLLFSITNQLKIISNGIGPTEVHILVSIFYIIIFIFGVNIINLYTIIFTFASLMLFLFRIVYISQKSLWAIDMQEKNKIT